MAQPASYRWKPRMWKSFHWELRKLRPSESWALMTDRADARPLQKWETSICLCLSPLPLFCCHFLFVQLDTWNTSPSQGSGPNKHLGGVVFISKSCTAHTQRYLSFHGPVMTAGTVAKGSFYDQLSDAFCDQVILWNTVPKAPASRLPPNWTHMSLFLIYFPPRNCTLAAGVQACILASQTSRPRVFLEVKACRVLSYVISLDPYRPARRRVSVLFY